MEDQKYEPCYVAFLDILGFSAKVVESRRKSEILKQLIDSLNICSCIPSGGKKIDSDGEKRTLEIQSRYCSDTIGFFMKEEKKDFPHLLFIVRYLQDRLWELGICLRGGIALGKMYWNPKEPNITLGTGWIKAYKLESEIAIYPRIVVAEDLYESFQNHSAKPFAKEGFLKDYIKKDFDGVYFLDLLNRDVLRKKGEVLESRNGDFSIIWNLSAESSNLHIENEVQRICKDGFSSGNFRVQQKYHWLENYLFDCARCEL